MVNPPRPRAYVIPPDNGWSTVRLLLTRLLNLGYCVEQHVVVGQSILVIKG
jgi:hypothetical protein